MEDLPHVMLAGEGAARFADTLGMDPEDLLTAEAEDAWRRARGAAPAIDPEHVGGTVNFLAQDRDGRIASAVSTSAWAWKHPGRVGDSPIIGAGTMPTTSARPRHRWAAGGPRRTPAQWWSRSEQARRRGGVCRPSST